MKKATLLTCHYCNREFPETSSHRYRQKRNPGTSVFCSRKCNGLAQRVNVPNSTIKEYLSGKSLQELGTIHNISSELIRRFLIENNTPLRNTTDHFINNNYTKIHGHNDATRNKIRQKAIQQFSDPAARSAASLKQSQALSSGKISKTSQLEEMVASHLNTLNIKYRRQVWLSSLNKQHSCCVDFLLADGRAIEVNGTYWHSDPRIYPAGPINYTQKHTHQKYQVKKNVLKEHNIPLIELWELDIRRDVSSAIKNSTL